MTNTTTYKIVYLEKENPSILKSRMFSSKEDALNFASQNSISDYLINVLESRDGDSYTWRITEDGLGKEFIKNYKSFETMRTKNQRLIFFGTGVVGGMIAFFLAKKILPSIYASALVGILGSIASMNLYLRIKTK